MLLPTKQQFNLVAGISRNMQFRPTFLPRTLLSSMRHALTHIASFGQNSMIFYDRDAPLPSSKKKRALNSLLLSLFLSLLGSICLSVIPRCIHRGLVESARTFDRTGCEFESWQCRINITSHVHIVWISQVRWVLLGTYGLIQKRCLVVLV